MMTKLHHKVAYLAITLSLALAVWLMPAMKAAAAETNIATVDPMRTLFSAEYYAEKNRDVAEKYGNDADALYAHFLRYGIAEERENLSPAIDLVAYKAANPDLQAAFGDDWKAYWKHYVIHGVREIANGQRIATGTKFFAKAYAEAYPDVVAVLGDDPASLLWHYCHYGYAENRTKGTAYAAKSRSNTSNANNTQSASNNASADAGKEDTSGNSPSEKPSGGNAGEKPEEKPGDEKPSVPGVEVEIGNNSETATVSAEVYQQLESGKATAVVMKNTAGTIKLPLAALRAAGGANAQIVAKQYNEVPGATNGTVTDAEGNVIDVANAVGIDVKLQNGDTEKKVSGLTDAEQIQIAVPKPENLDTSVELDAYYVNGGGKLELVGPVTVEGNTLTFKTSHLTQFIILARKHTIALKLHAKEMFLANGNCKMCKFTLTELQNDCPSGQSHKTTSVAKGNCAICDIKIAHEHPTALEDLLTTEQCVCGEYGKRKAEEANPQPAHAEGYVHMLSDFDAQRNQCVTGLNCKVTFKDFSDKHTTNDAHTLAYFNDAKECGICKMALADWQKKCQHPNITESVCDDCQKEMHMGGSKYVHSWREFEGEIGKEVCPTCKITLKEFQEWHAKMIANGHTTPTRPNDPMNPPRCDACNAVLEYVHEHVYAVGDLANVAEKSPQLIGKCLTCEKPCPNAEKHGKDPCEICGEAEHMASSGWFLSEDRESHWQKCIKVGHGEKLNEGSHEFDEGVYDEEEGSTTKTCVCGVTTTEYDVELDPDPDPNESGNT